MALIPGRSLHAAYHTIRGVYDMMDHWVPAYFVYFVVLSTVLLIRQPVAEWAYSSSARVGYWARQRSTARGPVALPTDTDPDIERTTTPQVDSSDGRDLERRASSRIARSPRLKLLVPMILGMAGVVLSWFCKLSRFIVAQNKS